jgi:hypothetical protein
MNVRLPVLCLRPIDGKSVVYSCDPNAMNVSVTRSIFFFGQLSMSYIYIYIYATFG